MLHSVSLSPAALRGLLCTYSLVTSVLPISEIDIQVQSSTTMAPTGTRKIGKTRMSSALDAMEPMGFPRMLVRSKLYQLLREYGGTAAYPFIEADAYRVLIEALLADGEEKKKHGEPKFEVGKTSMQGEEAGVDIGSTCSHPVSTKLQANSAGQDGNRQEDTCSHDNRPVEDTGGYPAGDVDDHDYPIPFHQLSWASPSEPQGVSTQRRKRCCGRIVDTGGDSGLADEQAVEASRLPLHRSNRRSR